MAGPRILIVEARFYEDVADNLVKGAVAELAKRGAGYKRLLVPGILEIPSAIRFAIRSMELRATDERYAGYLALGCAIRGETDHYDHVCHIAMTGLRDLMLNYSLAIGNAVLTCPSKELALSRSLPDGKHNFGGRAASAVMRMMEVKRELGL